VSGAALEPLQVDLIPHHSLFSTPQSPVVSENATSQPLQHGKSG